MRRIATYLVALTLISLASTGCTLFKKKTDMQASRSDATSDDMYADDGYASTYTPRSYESPSRSNAGYGTATRADEPVYAEPAYSDETTGGSRYHVVTKSDTLYKLARSYYSDQSKWRDIYEANRSSIDDPNFIRVGQRLLIP